MAAATAAVAATQLTSTVGMATPTTINSKPQKVVLYNPKIDYSAPLQQQINPELIGAHPHVQQHQQQYNNHNANQVRQQPQQQQQQPQQHQRAPVMSHAQAALGHLSLAGIAAAITGAGATTPATSLMSVIGGMQQPQPQSQPQSQQLQQQQPQQQQLLPITAATLPLKLSEQCSISNPLNNFVNELNAIKSGHGPQQQSSIQQQHQQQLQVGLLGCNGDSSGSITNSSVSSSISNLLISNNLTSSATTTTAAATTATASPISKLDTRWAQSPTTPATPALYNSIHQGFGNSSTYEAISSLWGCSSNASSTSGCSSACGGSQPSLSPTSTMSTRPNYRSNSKESLWSQTSPSNNLRDNYYAAKGVAIATADGGGNGGNGVAGGGGGGMNADVGANTSASPSAFSASSSSSTCSSGLGSAGWPIATNCSSGHKQSYFGGVSGGSPQIEDSSQFAKISNIWEIPNPAAAVAHAPPATATAAALTRSNGLFTDLWANVSSNNSAGNGNANNNSSNNTINTNANANKQIDNSDASSSSSSAVTAIFMGGNNDRNWRSAAPSMLGGRALMKQSSLSGNAMRAIGGGGGGGVVAASTNLFGPTAGANMDGNAATIGSGDDFFTEEFFNYLNLPN